MPGRYKLLGQVLIAGGVLGYAFLAREHVPPDWWEIRNRLSIPFVAFAKHPVVAAILIPFGGGSILALLEYLSTAR